MIDDVDSTRILRGKAAFQPVDRVRLLDMQTMFHRYPQGGRGSLQPVCLIGPDIGHQPQAIFEKLRDQFDFIIIDAPPVLGISDSLSLGQYIDGAILTVLRDHSEIRKVYKAVEMLKGMGVRVLGSVVNGMPMKADRRVVRLHQSGGSSAPRLTKVED